MTMANIGTGFSGIILLPLFTKFLGVNDYGLYIQVTVSISLIMSFVTLGLPYTTVRYLSAEKNRRIIQDDVYSTLTLVILFSILISIIFLIISNKLAQLLFDGKTMVVIILAFLFPIEAILWTLLNLFRAFNEIKKFAIFSLIRTCSELLILTLVILLGHGIVSILVVLLFFRTFLLVTTLLYTISYLGIVLPKFARMKDYLKFSLPTIPGNIAAWITDSSDRYLISIYLGTLFVGYYNPGYSLGSIISMLMIPINFVLVSSLSKYYDNNKIDVIENIFKYSIKYFLILAIPASFGLSILSLPILELLTTSEIANMCYLVTPLIAFSSLFYCIGGGIIFFSLYLTKRTGILMIIWVLVACLNFILNILFIPIMGILGAALATLISQLFGFIYGTFYSYKYFNFRIEYLSILKSIISSTIMAALINSSLLNISIFSDTVEIIFKIIIGIVVYLILIVSLGTLNAEEVSFLKSLFHKSYSY